MSDLVFDRTKKTLAWPAKNLSWGAVSGPFGAGALPPGTYDVGKKEITAYTSQIDISYRDKTGMGFFLPIYPKFTTNRGKSGGRLGIHPDGNKPGTLGCIGITDTSAKSFHDVMRSMAPNATITLLVK